MFTSFFPRPKLLFLSAAGWALFCILFWYFAATGWGDTLSIGGLFGYGFPPELASDADDAAKAAFAAAQSGAQEFWFYQYFVIVLAAFVGFWMRFFPHPWQRWSMAGSALILFVNWFLVQLDVMINEWFGKFYDMIQRALSAPNTVGHDEYYGLVVLFLQIAMTYVIVASGFRFFVSHYIFRWRTAMNSYYVQNWERLRHIEGAAQRVQEDTMRFASISQGLGVSFVDAIMTLVAFLPVLWVLSAQVKVLPLVGEVSQGLVFVAILWSIIGTTLVAVAGVRLPGLEFRNQRVEAAYRKELVYGEDDSSRAEPPTLRELFGNVRFNYFRLYLNYFYFNLVRICYLQLGVMVPYVALAPTIVAAGITLGVMQQIARAFGRVESSFQYLVNSWDTIVELMSIYKRLKAFEATLKGEELPELDKEYLATQRGQPA